MIDFVLSCIVGSLSFGVQDMPHEITIREDGFAEAAFSMTPAWHGLGVVFDHPMTSKECLTAAGLDWQVIQQPVFYQKDDEYISIPGHLVNLRSDNQFVLGMVSDHYKVVNNVEAFEFLDSLVEGHEMQYESAFSLYGGRRVVLLAKMPGYKSITKGDDILPYILLSLSHDGTEGIRFGPCATRVVCANTHAIALSETDGGGKRRVQELSIRHSGDIKSKLQRARDILAIASREFSQYAEIGQALAQRRLTREEWEEFLNIMCPIPSEFDPDYTERRVNALLETRESITSSYFGSLNQTAPETAWAAYCAVVEHIDHLPRRGGTQQAKAEARFNVALYGTGRDQKQRAWEAACRFAGIAC